MLHGIPGSGKTKWADAQDAVVISSEKIRENLFGSSKKYLNLRPEEIKKVRELEESLALKEDYVIVDSVNLTKKDVNRWLTFSHDNKIEVKHKNFDVDLETALSRNEARRKRGEMVYSDQAISSLYTKTVDSKGKLPSWKYSPSKRETYMIVNCY